MLSTFAFGVIGAAFPEIIRLYNLRMEKLKIPWTYFIIAPAFMAVSGLVVTALPGHLTHIAAVYAGTAAPLIISRGGSAGEFAFSKSRNTQTPDELISGRRGVNIDDISLRASSAVSGKIRAPSGALYNVEGFYRFLSAL